MNASWITALTLLLSSLAGADAPREPRSYLPAVRAFADNVLRWGRDVYGPKHTPLFVDGLNVDTHEPAIWKLSPENAAKWGMPAESVLCNLASQQNFIRVLVALTAMTGDPNYKQAAIDATRYALANLRHESGLLFWGGHAAWDLATDQLIGEGRGKGGLGTHELKSSYPFYELMWEVDREATRTFVESFWFNHILQWDILDMNRHGYYQPVVGEPWTHDYVGGPVPFAGQGLTFMNTGSDLFFAGAMLYKLSQAEPPLVWAKRIAQRYADACDPRTGLGADNYSTLTPDRMTQQFGAEFGNRFTEATVTSLYGARYTRVAICQLKLAEWMGPRGEEFKRWAVADLAAYARHAYDPSDNAFWPTLIDGTRLTPADRKRDGYVERRWLEKRPAGASHLWAYALAYRLTGDEVFWRMVRHIGQGLGLGDVGESPAGPDHLNATTPNADPETILALIEIHRQVHREAYLSLAARIGDNILQHQFKQGLFVPDENHLFARVDAVAPLALLHLEVALRGVPIQLPEYLASKPYFHGPFDGLGRTYDHNAIYARVRDQTQPATRSADDTRPAGGELKPQW